MPFFTRRAARELRIRPLNSVSVVSGTSGSNPLCSSGESGANSSQVDEVAERFRTFEELGYTDVLVRHLSNDQPKVLGSLERLAAVRAALA
jgi:hypothetical protein